MSVKVEFSEKSPSPQPFSEPLNMTTIELNKNGFFDDVQTPVTTKNKAEFVTAKIIKSVILTVALFVLFGLCVSVLVLLIYKGHASSTKQIEDSSQSKMSLQAWLNDKEKIETCKRSKTLQDCCYIFFNTNLFTMEKCTVQKILNLFLQYELEMNKRSKRQNYNSNDGNDQFYNPLYSDGYEDEYENARHFPDYKYEQTFFDESEPRKDYYENVEFPPPPSNPALHYKEQYSELNNQEYDKRPLEFSQIPSPQKPTQSLEFPYLPHYQDQPKEPLVFPQAPHHKEEFVQPLEFSHLPNYQQQTKDPVTFPQALSNPASNFQNQNREPLEFQPPPNTRVSNYQEQYNKNLDFSKTNRKEATLCTDDCPSVVNATTKIQNITNISGKPAKLDISINDTSIKLTATYKPQPRINEANQGNQFVIKQPQQQQQQQQQQQNPCMYPYFSPFVSPFRSSAGYEANPFFGMQPSNVQHQPLYIINPPTYPYSYNIPGYVNYGPQVMKNQVQVSGAGGQYYLCNPVSTPSNNVATLPGIEVRSASDGFNLQELVESMVARQKSNTTREAIDCPSGTRSCGDGSKCIHTRQLCDNEVNCNDASDEMNCSCRSRVGEIRWCDGYLDCPNGEDEDSCFNCKENEFSCDDWSRFQRGTCVPITQRCDGITQCEITGKDEEDCSILTDHVGHHALHKVSNAVGFLHRNYKGQWYPTCLGGHFIAADVCRTEAGPSHMMPTSHLVQNNDKYQGQYVEVSNSGISLVNSCMRSKSAFVECPPLFCGIRLTISNPFRTSEVDTSAEELLNHLTRSVRSPEEVVGESRVVGGKPSQPTAWPWVVSIYKNGVFHCGGVLINELWILTAAHCVDKFWFYYYEVQAGILRRFSYSPMEQTRWATTAIPHENYNKKSLKNDIALMKLSKPVRFNRYVRPICLPSENTAGEDFLKGPKPNTVCAAVGWGAMIEHGIDPDHLREVEIPILDHCKHIEDREGDEICAGLSEGGRDACQGDSGGPLMCQNIKNRSQWYLAGIVSHGEGCARPNEPGVYTKVAKYLGWISDKISGQIVGRVPLKKCPGYICAGVGKCLPKKRRCDKIVDCLFGDDEMDCWQSHNQPIFRARILGSTQRVKIQVETNFTCTNILQTIPFEEKCDKVVNCEDGTDESECLCVDHLKKFDKDAICDGTIDCKDLSDEVNCVECGEDEYLCRTSQSCVPLKERCDGREVCASGEDEWDCVALTDGSTLVLDSDLRPKQSMKGIITINRFGVWRPLCSNISAEDPASIASNICNLLGFDDYTAFHKLSVADKPLDVTIDGFQRHNSSLVSAVCGGLFVGCLNVSLVDVVHEPSRDNITDQLELYSVPWNAVIYSDGRFRCTGTILNSHWIIAASACLPDAKHSYITVLLGKGKAHLQVEGPHEQTTPAKTYVQVQGSEAIILYVEDKIRFNRYVKPTEPTAKSAVAKLCLASGVRDNRSFFVKLHPSKECKIGFSCFKTDENSCTELLEEWSGVIVCSSKRGWTPAAAFSRIRNTCDFAGLKFATIQKIRVALAMGNEVESIEPKPCPGFRCNLGNCIDTHQLCDGVIDCRNEEDEDLNICSANLRHLTTNQTNWTYCKWSEFKCPNGECIPKALFCNGVNDCKDNFDEPASCTCRTYLEALHPTKICDGVVNCWDRSDEDPRNCTCKPHSGVKCGQRELCVSQEMMCDGFRDCPGGEDESRCHSLKTNLANVDSGEVMRRTAGVWHSGCFARNLTTSKLEEICQRLGFVGSSARRLEAPKDADAIGLIPVMDRFDDVWIGTGNRTKLRLRAGSKPYVRLVQDPTCTRLYLQCI